MVAATDCKDQNRSGMRVLVVSVAYHHGRILSDKQFISDLITSIPQNIDIAVWTINETPPADVILELSGRRLRYVCKNRIFHRPSCSGENGLTPHHKHSLVWNFSEIFLSYLCHLFGSLGKIIREINPDVVHFTDNPGPILWLLRLMFRDVRVTCVRPTTLTGKFRGRRFYDLMVKGIFLPADKVITFTHACKEALMAAGIDETRLRVIPWASKLEHNEPVPGATTDVFGISPRKHFLMIAVDDRCVRQGRLPEFVQWAKGFAERCTIRFVVCVKENKFKAEYEYFSSDCVKIIGTSPVEFHKILYEADILLSSQDPSNRTVLPPLAWIDAMLSGTAIVVPYSSGVEEIAIDGITGYAFRTTNQLESILTKLIEDTGLLYKLKRSAQSHAQAKYAFPQISKEYVSLWSDCVSDKNKAVTSLSAEQKVLVDTAYDENTSLSYDSVRFTSPAGKLFHNLEVRQLEEALQYHRDKSTVLEVGCGTGRFVDYVLRGGHQLICIDASQYMLELCAEKHGGKKNVRFQLAEAAGLGFPDDMFDFVYSIRLINQLESVEYAKKAILEMMRVVKPGGILLLEFCNLWRPKRGTGVRLSVPCVMQIVQDHPSARCIKTRGILFLSQTLLNMVPIVLLPTFKILDDSLSWCFPKLCARCYLTIRK